MRLNYVMEMTRKRNATQKRGTFRSRYSTGTRVSLKFTPWMQLKQGPLFACVPSPAVPGNISGASVDKTGDLASRIFDTYPDIGNCAIKKVSIVLRCAVSFIN